MKKILFLLAFALTACSSSDAAFEGTWKMSGVLADGFNFYLQYSFEDGEYRMEGYPSIVEEGTYTVLSQEGNTYTVEFLVDGAEAMERVIEVTKDGEAIEMGGQEFQLVK